MGLYPVYMYPDYHVFEHWLCILFICIMFNTGLPTKDANSETILQNLHWLQFHNIYETLFL